MNEFNPDGTDQAVPNGLGQFPRRKAVLPV